MREVVTMWRHTKMVVLVALTAGVYAAILIPLKGIPLVPGITELRPANVVPVVFSILFGPAAAWGAAFGNLIGDFFGTLGLGSIFGFVGNFFYGLVAYKLCGKMGPLSSKEPMEARTGRQIVEYLLLAFLASASCAAIISWGVDLFGLVPFGVLGPVITLNNFLAAAIISSASFRFIAKGFSETTCRPVMRFFWCPPFCQSCARILLPRSMFWQRKEMRRFSRYAP